MPGFRKLVEKFCYFPDRAVVGAGSDGGSIFWICAVKIVVEESNKDWSGSDRRVVAGRLLMVGRQGKDDFCLQDFAPRLWRW